MRLAMDFSVIAKAGLTQQEFGDLVGVSRVTTNTWVRGKMEPHRFIKAHVAEVLRALQLGLKEKWLPMTEKRPDKRASVLEDCILCTRK